MATIVAINVISVNHYSGQSDAWVKNKRDISHL